MTFKTDTVIDKDIIKTLIVKSAKNDFHKKPL